MYEKVKSCVKSCNNFSDFFEYSVGLRQGEVISPIFGIFVSGGLRALLAKESRIGFVNR